MALEKYSQEIANVVKQYLTEDDWKYFFDEERGRFVFELCIGGKIQRIRYHVNVRENQLLIYGIAPVGVECEDSAAMAEMAEFICRANYGLRNGSFEFDFRDGEIRYKSFIDCEDAVPTVTVVKNAINIIAGMYQKYGKALVEVIFLGVSAKEAVERCEQAENDAILSMLRELYGEDASGDTTEMLEHLKQEAGMLEDEEE